MALKNSPLGAELHGTKQVAEMLGIPEWRVKNFTEGERYCLPPAHRIGKGRGSRRLYGWEDIFRIGLAEKLVNAGFAAEAVGRAVTTIPHSLVAKYAAMCRGESKGLLKMKHAPVLLCTANAWQIDTAPQNKATFSKVLKHGESSSGLFAINLANVFDSTFSRLQQYCAEHLDQEKH